MRERHFWPRPRSVRWLLRGERNKLPANFCYGYAGRLSECFQSKLRLSHPAPCAGKECGQPAQPNFILRVQTECIVIGNVAALGDVY